MVTGPRSVRGWPAEFTQRDVVFRLEAEHVGGERQRLRLVSTKTLVVVILIMLPSCGGSARELGQHVPPEDVEPLALVAAGVVQVDAIESEVEILLDGGTVRIGIG